MVTLSGKCRFGRPWRRMSAAITGARAHRRSARCSMLSRVAESCYWMGRYVERAEDVARIVDVNYHGVIENSSPEAAPAWWSVVATTGDAEAFLERYPHPTEMNVADFLLLDSTNPNSVASSVAAARESG